MIDESLLNSLNAKEKEIFKKGLKDLIDQTYVIEDEYKKLNESYTSLQDFIHQIIKEIDTISKIEKFSINSHS